MRYDTAVYFQRYGSSVYDKTTGNYLPVVAQEEVRFASVMDTRAEMLTLIYGALKQGTLTLQLQNHYTSPFDTVRIGGKRYKLDFERKLKTKHVMLVSEVP
jgi:hypothetical protein